MTYIRGLCAGRHDLPVSDFIFNEIADPKDVDSLCDIAWNAIPEDCDKLVLYITGLTVAFGAVVNVCARRAIALTAMHYDRIKEEYDPQVIFRTETCPFCKSRSLAGGYACPCCGAT